MDIPTKWDIIPIHTSDRGTFKKCRRKWDWNSPSRRNLVRRVDIFGLTVPLWFGTGYHYALEKMYDPILKADPVATFLQWFDIVYNGGIVTEDWLDRTYDPKPLPQETPGTYKVRGLNSLLVGEDHSEILEHRELGVNMLKYYKNYSERYDDFSVIATESSFSVPIWDYEDNCTFKAIDTREDSPNYGKVLEVHYRGRRDLLKVDNNTGRYGLMDHKTTARIDEDWFKTLELDEQCTSYLWVAEIEAKYYGLPWAGQPMEDIIYQACRKTYPKLPTILKNGMFSIDRKNESTTWPILKRVIELGGLQTMIDLDPKYQEYVKYVQEVGDEQFIVRKPVRRNRHQLVSAGKRIFLEARDMLSNPAIYPNPSGEYHCIHCPFRVPCIATEDGIDPEPMLTSDYYSNKGR